MKKWVYCVINIFIIFCISSSHLINIFYWILIPGQSLFVCYFSCRIIHHLLQPIFVSYIFNNHCSSHFSSVFNRRFKFYQLTYLLSYLLLLLLFYNVLFKDVIGGSLSLLVVASVNFWPYLSTKSLKKHKSQLTLVDFLSFGLIEYLMIDYIYLDFILIIILNLLYVLFQEACCFDQWTILWLVKHHYTLLNLHEHLGFFLFFLLFCWLIIFILIQIDLWRKHKLYQYLIDDFLDLILHLFILSLKYQ